MYNRLKKIIAVQLKVKKVRIISPLEQSLNSVTLLNHIFPINQLVKLNTSIVNTHKY